MTDITRLTGCEKNMEEASAVFCGIPYDETSTFRKGCGSGPEYIRKFSESIETYSPLQDKDMADMGMRDIGDVEFGSKKPEEAFIAVKKAAKGIIESGKRAFYAGGEHLVSLPLVSVYAEKFPGLNVIYLDAHADMRDDYEGEKFSHATAARRMAETAGFGNIYLFGVRSLEKNEASFIREKNIFCDPSFENLPDVCEKLKDTPVYISIDIDVFDPSEAPGVGNPEAGGLGYNDFSGFIKYFEKIKNPVAADVVELSPPYDGGGISAALAAKLTREMLILLGKNDQKR